MAKEKTETVVLSHEEMDTVTLALNGLSGSVNKVRDAMGKLRMAGEEARKFRKHIDGITTKMIYAIPEDKLYKGDEEKKKGAK